MDFERLVHLSANGINLVSVILFGVVAMLFWGSFRRVCRKIWTDPHGIAKEDWFAYGLWWAVVGQGMIIVGIVAVQNSGTHNSLFYVDLVRHVRFFAVYGLLILIASVFVARYGYAWARRLFFGIATLSMLGYLAAFAVSVAQVFF